MIIHPECKFMSHAPILVWCLFSMTLLPGSQFRKYPGMYRFYLADTERPGRFRLVTESPKRLAGDDLDELVSRARPATCRPPRRPPHYSACLNYVLQVYLGVEVV